MSVIQKAVLQIGNNLRPGLSADEVRRVVVDGVKGLDASQVQQVVDKFHREMARIGDEYFLSVIGVSKQTLVRELDALTPGSGGNGALNFMNAQRRQTINDVMRFMDSPRPGEGWRDLVKILANDRGLMRHGADKLDKLVERMAIGSLPIDALITAFDKTGQTEPASLVVDDPWLRSMLRSTGRDAAELAAYLSEPSRFDAARRFDNFFDPGARTRADAALRSLQEGLLANGGRDIAMEHTVPSAEKMSYADAKYVVEFELNDVRLEVKNGAFTIAAQYFNDSLSAEQVTRALEIMIGIYGTELRANKGAWADDVGMPDGAVVCPMPPDELVLEDHQGVGL